MKNIHLLPTTKEQHSIVRKHTGLLLIQTPLKEYSGTKLNIYITNDEFKQKTDWVIYKDVITKLEVGDNELFHLGKKIILTTDQDLIKDGVQAIEDKYNETFKSE
jgi:hypothetical protein